jgi:hypothetical protein
MLDPFFYQLVIAPEPQPARIRPISEDHKRAIITVATLSAVWLMVYMAPDIRRTIRTRTL